MSTSTEVRKYRHIRIQESTWRALKLRAIADGVTMTAVVASALGSWLGQEPPSPADEVLPRCPWCGRHAPREPPFCSPACQQQFATRTGVVQAIPAAAMDADRVVLPLAVCGWCQTALPANHGSAYCSVACAVAHSMEREGTPS